ncbi:MAG: VOC family protein [Chloroflexi bacterium]|nr:VOC family protein [Chloroflexota bacterium]
MPRVIHFELGADNPERAVSFYTKVFNWKVEKWAGPVEYWLVMTGPGSEPGIDGAILRRDSPGFTTVNSIDVPSVDEYVARIVANGGKVVAPKMPIPGVGYFAYCEDTEGNQFGIMQADTSVT